MIVQSNRELIPDSVPALFAFLHLYFLIHPPIVITVVVVGAKNGRVHVLHHTSSLKPFAAPMNRFTNTTIMTKEWRIISTQRRL